MYIYIYIFIYLLIWSPDVGFWPVRWIPSDVECCRFAGRRVPVTVGSLPCRVPPDHRLHHRSGFGWPKPLQVARPPPLLVQVTLNSLCSTHRHKDNNFCSTLYMVRALFVLSMWDISQFSLFLSQLPTHISWHLDVRFLCSKVHPKALQDLHLLY